MQGGGTTTEHVLLLVPSRYARVMPREIASPILILLSSRSLQPFYLIHQAIRAKSRAIKKRNDAYDAMSHRFY